VESRRAIYDLVESPRFVMVRLDRIVLSSLRGCSPMGRSNRRMTSFISTRWPPIEPDPYQRFINHFLVLTSIA
jgi:hypothetical protein